MERLTRKVDGKTVFPSELVGVTLTPDNVVLHELLCRLADYEDTGLTPEQCENAKVIIEAAFSNDTSKVERIRELLKADKDGRLEVVVRCKDCRYFQMYKCRMGYSRYDDFCSYGERNGSDNAT